MNKAFYKLINRLTLYSNCDNFQTNNHKLCLIHSALDPIEDFYVEIDRDDQNKTILIWSEDSFQKKPDLPFKTLQEGEKFNKAYWEYLDKRWEDMPKVKMSFEDYEVLVAKWEKIKQEKPAYIIFTLDDSGPLDVIDLIGKNELSQEDLQDMKRGHEEYLLWKKAESLYYFDHELVDDIWRSPEDSVYDADIVKYIGRETGFIKHKKYTRLEAVAEFKERLQKGEAVYLAVHWLHVRGVYDFGPLDPEVDMFLWDIASLDRNPADMARSSEQLIEMAEQVLAGQKVKIYDRGSMY